MLDQLKDGDVIDFEYIGFCDDISDVPQKDGEYIDYGWEQNWRGNIDSASANGQIVAKSTGLTPASGANQENVLVGSKWTLSGWFVFNGRAVNEFSICVTDEKGAEHRATVSKDNVGTHGRWWETTEVGDHTCRVNLSVNLRDYLGQDYLGQTVMVSIRAITADGRAVTVYAAAVKVQAQININGATLQDYAGSDYSATLNTDGSLTLTAKATTGDNYTSWFSGVAGIAAPKYAIIRYKTTSNTFIGINAQTESYSGYRWASGTIYNDGEWHTLILDLEGANYKVGEAIRNIRIDTCDSEGESVTIDYIYLCDSINEDLLDYDVDLINANNTYIDAAVGTIERTPESIKITSKGFTNDASRMSVAINGASVGKYLVFT
jgi:uncharacterized lipoprotein NlpE involved in copper resistance